MSRFLRTIVGLAVWLHPAVADAQGAEVRLRGIWAVDAKVLLQWDDRISRVTKRQAEIAMGSRLTLELRKLGLVVQEGVANVLVCKVMLLSDDRRVIWNESIDLEEPVKISRVPDPVWVVTWSSGAVGIVGEANLLKSLEENALSCAEKFGNAWLAANPRR